MARVKNAGPAGRRLQRHHALVLSVLLAAAGVLGTLAATRTADLGATTTKPKRVPDSVIAKRARKLDAFEASLKQTLAKRPGRLPSVPTYAPVRIPSVPAVPTPAPVSRTVAAAPAAQPAAAPRPRPVKYVQPPPVVKHVPAPTTTTTPSHHDRDDEEEHGDREASREQAKLDRDCRDALDLLAAEQAKPHNADRIAEAQKQAYEKCREAQKQQSEHGD